MNKIQLLNFKLCPNRFLTTLKSESTEVRINVLSQ